MNASPHTVTRHVDKRCCKAHLHLHEAPTKWSSPRNSSTAPAARMQSNTTKTAQYHDATNDMRYLIFSWYFPRISQKQLGTMMLQMTRVISFSNGISHEIHQSSSVPWCYKKHTLSQFFMLTPMKFTKTAQYHDATHDTRYLIFHGISHESHQSSSVPWCYKWRALSHFFMVFISHKIHQSSPVPWCYKW